jgi:hypothetical protein
VLAQGDAAWAGRGLFELCDDADLRLVAVGADDPAGSEGIFAGLDLVAVNAFDDGMPVKTDTEREGAIEQKLVKHGAGKTTSVAVGKDGFGGVGAADEPNAAQGVACGLKELLRRRMVEVDAELGESGEGVGHEAFAAGFVDRGLSAVCYFDLKALTGCGDGTG